ncbi:transglutaminase domain-containing protein [Nakamurella antarctica]|uniref:Transglutaminase domain-containing protein n=1 Tax=Nakamurella antarctica TaxID=1902245 RepID=A0A3G8ZKD0_9ACTN|nr:DUF3488 and transglutaminase-like domain-containing protein [Nakamurella antarctica]AZI57660.1 transglutaminase domain-containing protein [Nakamurella antarctica]
MSTSTQPAAAPKTATGARAKKPPHSRSTSDSAYPLIGLLGALTVVAGASPLTTTLKGSSWVPAVLQVVALVWLIGFGCRLLRLPSPVVLGVQILGVITSLTSLFTDSGSWGLIPNSRVLAEAQELIRGAWSQIQNSAPPAESTPQLGFLIAITLALVALVVDFLVTELQAPALVALPLLVMYSIPASISNELLPWWTFAVPAVSYAALLAASDHAGKPTSLRAGVGVAVTGAIAVVVAVTVSLVVADSVTAIGTEGRLPRSNANSAGKDVGLSPFTSLKGNLQRGDPVDVLQVAGLTSPDYLRTAGLEVWTAGEGFSEGDPGTGTEPVTPEFPLAPLADNPSAALSVVTVQTPNFSDRYLPIYPGTATVSDLGPGWNYNRSLGSIFRPESVNPGGYSMLVALGKISPEALRADTVTAGGNLTDQAGVPISVVELARSVTASATSAFDKAFALTQYFTTPSNGFQYSLEVPSGSSGDALVDFLKNKQGYCEQYATAMTVMLRTVGIPARVAIGFTQGTETAPGAYTISSHDAHAWVEVRFDKAGWVRFDPTPLGVATGGQQGFAEPAAPSEPTPTPSATPSQSGQDDTGRPSGITQTNTVTSTQFDAGGAATGSPGRVPTWLWVGLLLVLALIGLGAAPSLLRRRRSRLRLQVAARGGADAAPAAWSEIEDLAVDHGFSFDRVATVRSVANSLATKAALGQAARAGLRRVALATEESWYSANIAVSVGAAAHHAGAVRPDGDAARVDGDAARVDGDAARVDGDAARVDGDAARVDSDAARVDGAANSDLTASVALVRTEFAHTAPLSLLDRLVPRSVRSRVRR